jgi:hypothetical protein
VFHRNSSIPAYRENALEIQSFDGVKNNRAPTVRVRTGNLTRHVSSTRRRQAHRTIQHEATRNYDKNAPHDRKEQTDDASKDKNPAKNDGGDASKSFLSLGDSDLLHTTSPIRHLADQSPVIVGSNFSDEHRTEGGERPSPREGISKLNFSYAVMFKCALGESPTTAYQPARQRRFDGSAVSIEGKMTGGYPNEAVFWGSDLAMSTRE